MRWWTRGKRRQGQSQAYRAMSILYFQMYGADLQAASTIAEANEAKRVYDERKLDLRNL